MVAIATELSFHSFTYFKGIFFVQNKFKFISLNNIYNEFNQIKKAIISLEIYIFIFTTKVLGHALSACFSNFTSSLQLLSETSFFFLYKESLIIY